MSIARATYSLTLSPLSIGQILNSASSMIRAPLLDDIRSIIRVHAKVARDGRARHLPGCLRSPACNSADETAGTVDPGSHRGDGPARPGARRELYADVRATEN